MSRKVNIREAGTKLSQLVEDAARGEEIVIVRNGRPVAKLTAVAPAAPPQAKGKRKLGQWAHLMTPEERAYYRSDQFLRDWKAMDAEIERDFEVLREPPQEFKWDDTSSIPAPSSARKKTSRRSGHKRAK
ncbi:MAG TPA: type II toxin-antitoxin system prevent-host-death family antitoxin [Rhizomicrobium sp.]|nr:type II toxin-antitoxin system prevent-host-death family antitoxin [Rhizomicrobium sp.]